MSLTQSFLNQFSTLSEQLSDKSYALFDDVFLKESFTNLSEAFDQKRNHLKKAQIGRQNSLSLKSEIRNDFNHWLNPEDISFQALFHLLETIKAELKQGLYLPIRRFEIQMSLYPKDHFYRLHVDRHKGLSERLVTMVYYLNSWQNGDGGELKIILPNQTFLQVEPLKNRLVIFFSELEHEVLTTQKERRSFTAWFREDIL